MSAKFQEPYSPKVFAKSKGLTFMASVICNVQMNEQLYMCFFIAFTKT